MRLTVARRLLGTSAPEDLFPHLEQVVIQPRPGPTPSTHQGTAELSYRDFVNHIRKSAAKARVPVLLLPSMELPKQASGMDPSRGCIMKLRGVWQQAIEGKHLTWETPVAEPSAPDGVQSQGTLSTFLTPRSMNGMVAVGA